MNDLLGKKVVITGAAKGIGKATVDAFYKIGAVVFALDRDREALKTLKDSFPDIYTFSVDVSQEKEVKQTFQAISQVTTHIDILINNAGIQRYGSVTDTTVEMWDEVMNVNLKSAFLCAQQAIPQMNGGKSGVIINVSSVQAFITQQKVAAYTTSKTALLGLTRSIAVDYAPGIRCMAVCPGTVDTPMLRESIRLSPDPEAVLRECEQMHLTGKIGTPEQVASLILFLTTESAAFMTGQAVRIDGGLGITIGGSIRE